MHVEAANPPGELQAGCVAAAGRSKQRALPESKLVTLFVQQF
jgi:hypothetical protein